MQGQGHHLWRQGPGLRGLTGEVWDIPAAEAAGEAGGAWLRADQLLAAMVSIRVGSLPEGLGLPQARRRLARKARSTRGGILRAERLAC